VSSVVKRLALYQNGPHSPLVLFLAACALHTGEPQPFRTIRSLAFGAGYEERFSWLESFGWPPSTAASAVKTRRSVPRSKRDRAAGAAGRGDRPRLAAAHALAVPTYHVLATLEASANLGVMTRALRLSLILGAQPGGRVSREPR